MRKPILQLTIIIFLFCFIWFLSPYIAINGYEILNSETHRLLLLLIVTFLWGINNFFGLSLHQKSGKENKEKDFLEDDFEKTLTKHFQQALSYIKRKTPQNFFKRNISRTPLYLIIGAEGAGKNTLLDSTNIPFKTFPHLSKSVHKASSNQFSNTIIEHDNDRNEEPQTDSKYCQWRVFDDGIFVNIPGAYATCEIGLERKTPWNTILELFNQNKKACSIKSVTIIISLPELITQDVKQRRLLVYLLKYRLLEIKKKTGNVLPLNIIFTKCDLIAGFREYFDHLKDDERKEILGIEFSKISDEHNYTDQFNSDFDKLLKQLNSHVITRIHQENTQEKRNLIKEFTVQLDSIKKTISNVIFHLAEKTGIHDATKPNGIYFTSALQKGIPVNILHYSLSEAFDVSKKQLAKIEHFQSKTYFLDRLIRKIIQQDHFVKQENIRPIYKSWHRRIVISSAVGLVAATSIYMGTMFSRDLILLNSTQAMLEDYMAMSNNGTANNSLNSIDVLNQVIKSYHKATGFWLFSHNASFDVKSYEMTRLHNQFVQSKNLLTGLANQIQDKLNKTNISPIELYNDLKAYLMLGNSSHYDKTFILDWLKNNSQWLSQNAALNTAQLTQLLSSFTKNHMPIKLNQQTIMKARNSINAQPKGYLAYVILRSDAIDSRQQPLIVNQTSDQTNQSLLDPSASLNQIPYLFTAGGFNNIFLAEFLKASNEATKGNWVLGNKTQEQTTPQDVADQLIELYFSDYSSWWSTKIYKLNFSMPKNLNELYNFTSALSRTNSPLTSILQTIILNTSPKALITLSQDNMPDQYKAYIQQTINKKLDEKFLKFLQFFKSSKKQNQNIYAQIQSTFQSLNSELAVIQNSGNQLQASFNMASFNMKDQNQQEAIAQLLALSKQAPQPFQDWLNSFSLEAWSLILQSAQNYINNQWQNTVLNTYSTDIANRYPLFKNSDKDINLSAFQSFFAPNGILENFFNQNISPFVNTDQPQWQWKYKHGLKLNMPDSVLQLFERARIISAMYFRQNKLTADFSLQQIALMPVVKKFSLTLDGQSLSDERGTKNISRFLWPGNGNSMSVNIEFDDVNGQHISSSEVGVWALFRLLDKTTVQPTNDPTHYKVTFDIDGNEARYLLVVDNAINPFVPGIIEQFRPPETLS